MIDQTIDEGSASMMLVNSKPNFSEAHGSTRGARLNMVDAQTLYHALPHVAKL